MRIPDDCGPSARSLWDSVLADFKLSEHELVLLRQAVSTLDLLDRLAEVVAAEGPITDAGRVHPAVVESRQQRIALARLLAALRLPGEDGGAGQRPQRRVGVRGVYGGGSS